MKVSKLHLNVIVKAKKCRQRERGVPKGHLPVYVQAQGQDQVQRYVVKIKYLQHPLFCELLQQSADEFGYSNNGGIRLACNSACFENLLQLLSSCSTSSSSSSSLSSSSSCFSLASAIEFFNSFLFRFQRPNHW